MKNLLLLLALSVYLFSSCKKEEPDTEKPVVSGDKPIDNTVINLGNAFDFQGIVYDNEELSMLYIVIESPNASYNYQYIDSIELTGTSYDFYDWITIPVDASVGVAEFKVYAFDASGNQSATVQRSIQLRDKIDPEINIGSTLVEDNDSIVFTLYKNTDNVFDSLTAYNYTKSALLSTIKDIGGFKELVIRRYADSDAETGQLEVHELTTITASIHTIGFTIDLDDSYSAYYYLHPPFLEFAVVEYRTPIDYGPVFSELDNGHHTVLFEVIP